MKFPFFGRKYRPVPAHRGLEKAWLGGKILLVFPTEMEMTFSLEKLKKMLEKEKWEDIYKIRSHLPYK